MINLNSILKSRDITLPTKFYLVKAMVFPVVMYVCESTLAASCKEFTHWKRLWCWEGLGARGEGDRRWDVWMASLTRWTWVWVNLGSWWWTGRPGVLRFMGLQRVRHDWATDLIWCWIGLPIPTPGDLPEPGIEPVAPALAVGFFTTELPWKPY